MKFGNAEIGRLVAGCNPFYGFSHFNDTLSALMAEWYTPERVCAVLNQCSRVGINAFNVLTIRRCPDDLERFQAQGGQMHLIVQGTADDPTAFVKRWPFTTWERWSTKRSRPAPWTPSGSGARRPGIWACWSASALTSRK